MKPHALIVIASLVFLAACGGGGSDAASEGSSAPARCYELVEGASRAVVKVESAPAEGNPDGGRITVYSYVDGAEEFDPETTPGRLEADAFVYGDGTRLELTDSSLTWPAGSLLDGAVFTATSCP